MTGAGEAGAALELRRLPRIGDGRACRLIREFGSPGAALAQRGEDWVRIVGEAAAREAASVEPDSGWAESQIAEARAAGVEIAPFASANYPAPVAQLCPPPAVLYVAGRLGDRRIAIVGTRRCSESGRRLARKMAGELAAAGICVVSGLADGIDAAAHEGALEAGGATAAVLGSGLDLPSPAGNRALYRRILETGAAVSEQPMGVPASAGTFPRRNRIISALCAAVVVAEAPARSGALITARITRDLGRPLFAVPGDVAGGRSSGCHGLIRRGEAGLVERAADVLESLGLAAVPHPGPQPSRPADDGSPEGAVAALLDETRHVDELSELSGLGPARTLDLLLRMEMAGRVVQLPGKRFCRP